MSCKQIGLRSECACRGIIHTYIYVRLIHGKKFNFRLGLIFFIIIIFIIEWSRKKESVPYNIMTLYIYIHIVCVYFQWHCKERVHAVRRLLQHWQVILLLRKSDRKKQIRLHIIMFRLVWYMLARLSSDFESCYIIILHTWSRCILYAIILCEIVRKLVYCRRHGSYEISTLT